jgi:nucleotide-binding universal stress UspA family protein
MIQTILFATDLGPFSAHAMEHTVDLAVSHRARVVVVHAVEPLNSFAQAMVSTYLDETTSPGDSSAPLLASIKSRILRSLADECSDSDLSFEYFSDVCVVQGRPAEVILREANRVGADLIVMGSHGPEAMGNNMLGSVTSRVLQLSKVPVYMVPMISPRNWCKLSDEGVYHRGA